MTGKRGFFTARNIALLGIFVALVVVLQAGLGAVRIGPTSFSLVLIPIVLGAILLGPVAGGILGFVFGLIVVIYGVTGLDSFTYFLFSEQPFFTVVLCLLKGTAAGVMAGLLHRLIARKNRYVGAFAAAAAAPVFNTGIFILGALCMSGTIGNYLATDPSLEGMSVVYFVVIGCAGINFLAEFAVNLIAAPVLYRVTEIIERQVKRGRA